MTSYNQKYKDQVIGTLLDKNGNSVDASLTSDSFFSAIGRDTGHDVLYKDTVVYSFSLYSVKQDYIFNISDGDNIKAYDDNGTLLTINTNGVTGNQYSALPFKFLKPLTVGVADTNITFNNFEKYDGMVTPISSLKNKDNVHDFTATVTVPNDVTCNYTTGNHQYVTGQSVNILFDGKIKQGDTITVKRNNRSDHTSVMQFDTDLAFINLSMDGNTALELIYNHKTPVTTVKKATILPTLLNAKIIDPEQQQAPSGYWYYSLNSNHPIITVKATDGYSFENDGTLAYLVDNKPVSTIIIKANHSNTITINIPDDFNWVDSGTFKLTLGASKPEVVQASGNFTNIYKADYNNLLSFSDEAITMITGGRDAGFTSIDLKPYINNLIMLPFDVPSGANAPIVAGDEKFKTQLPTVSKDFLTIDLGKIEIPEQYKNGFDYYQVKTRLMLPYTNLIDLDPIHVINKTISIQYVVNVVNGDTTINVYSDNDLFLSQQVNLANEIPFISKATSGSQYAVINQLKTHFRNEINQAYIIIEQPTPILNADYYATNEKGTLKNYTGNVKAKLLNNVDINSNDLITLQNLLETGVKIK